MGLIINKSISPLLVIDYLIYLPVTFPRQWTLIQRFRFVSQMFSFILDFPPKKGHYFFLSGTSFFFLSDALTNVTNIGYICKISVMHVASSKYIIIWASGISIYLFHNPCLFGKKRLQTIFFVATFKG